MEVIKEDDPVTLAGYAFKHNLQDQYHWLWTKKYAKTSTSMQKLIMHATVAKKKRKTLRYQFGVRVPMSIWQAQEFDKTNQDTQWADAIQKEVDSLYTTYKCFQEIPEGQPVPEGYQKIPLLWTFAVKFDGRRRARCVAGGHLTPDLEVDMYSGVVDLDIVRLAFIAAKLMNLQVVTADIGSAYIQAYTTEKVYTVAGPEFGPSQGKRLIIDKALYGLKSAGASWHAKLADNLCDMGFRPSKADYNLWIRQMEDHYEYVAVIVDDLLIMSKSPETITGTLSELFGYELKGLGTPEYYSGADMEYIPETDSWAMSAKTYINSISEKIEKLLEVKLKNYGSPMEVGDHPELDESDLLYGRDISLYQMLLGCAQWAIRLGRFDIQYATNTLARYGAMPRHGHYQRMLRVFGYLKHNARAKITFDPNPLYLEKLEFIREDWVDLYPDAQESMPHDLPKAMNKTPVQITAFLDASHASDMITGRSTTGYLLYVGHTPVKWYSKRQNTVETSSYGSELVAMRITVEAVLELRYMLRMMGIEVEPTSNILCDNQSVVINMQFPSSNLKKKHNAVAYHRCREAVAAGIIRVGHVRSEDNIADIMTKPKGPADYYKHLRPTLYGKNPPDPIVRGSCGMKGLNLVTLPPNKVTIDPMDSPRGARHLDVKPDTSSESQSDLTVTSDTTCQLEQGLDVTGRHLYLGDNPDHSLDVK